MQSGCLRGLQRAVSAGLPPSPHPDTWLTPSCIGAETLQRSLVISAFAIPPSPDCFTAIPLQAGHDLLKSQIMIIPFTRNISGMGKGHCADAGVRVPRPCALEPAAWGGRALQRAEPGSQPAPAVSSAQRGCQAQGCAGPHCFN